MSTLIRRIGKNSLVQLIAFAAKALTSFVVFATIARLSGVESLGVFGFVIAFATVFTFLSDLGIPYLLIREIARSRDDYNFVFLLINNAFTLTCVSAFSTAALIALAGITFGYAQDSVIVFFIAGLGLACSSLTNVWAAAFKAFERMEFSSSIVIAQECSFLLFVFVFLQYVTSPFWIFLSYLLSHVFALALAGFLYTRQLGSPAMAVDLSIWRYLLAKGWPFAVNVGLGDLYLRVDILILAALAGTVSVGLYEGATNIVVRFNVIARILNDSMYPILSRSFLSAPNQITSYTREAIHYLVIPGFFIATFLVIFGGQLAVSLYGNEFQQSGPAVQALAFVIPLRFITYSLRLALTASDRQGKRSLAIALSAVVNIVLNLLLIPHYSLMGAAYATLLTEVALFILLGCFMGKSLFEAMPVRLFAVPCIGMVSIGLCLWAFDGLSVLVRLPLCLLAYTAIVLLLDSAVRQRSVQLLYSLVLFRKTKSGLEAITKDQ